MRGRLSAADGDRPVSREWHALPCRGPEAPDRRSGGRAQRRRSAPPARARRSKRRGRAPRHALWRLVLAQFRSLVVLLLLAASVIAAALGQHVEALAILAALLLNAGIGFVTEWRARISLAKLRALTVPHALVRREGPRRIRAAEVVPGDLLVLERGPRPGRRAARPGQPSPHRRGCPDRGERAGRQGRRRTARPRDLAGRPAHDGLSRDHGGRRERPRGRDRNRSGDGARPDRPAGRPGRRTDHAPRTASRGSAAG